MAAAAAIAPDPQCARPRAAAAVRPAPSRCPIMPTQPSHHPAGGVRKRVPSRSHRAPAMGEPRPIDAAVAPAAGSTT